MPTRRFAFTPPHETFSFFLQSYYNMGGKIGYSKGGTKWVLNVEIRRGLWEYGFGGFSFAPTTAYAGSFSEQTGDTYALSTMRFLSTFGGAYGFGVWADGGY
jgi:hypothetical protein